MKNLILLLLVGILMISTNAFGSKAMDKPTKTVECKIGTPNDLTPTFTGESVKLPDRGGLTTKNNIIINSKFDSNISFGAIANGNPTLTPCEEERERLRIKALRVIYMDYILRRKTPIASSTHREANLMTNLNVHERQNNGKINLNPKPDKKIKIKLRINQEQKKKPQL